MRQLFNLKNEISNELVIEAVELELLKAFNNGIFVEDAELIDVIKQKKKLKLDINFNTDIIKNKKSLKTILEFKSIIKELISNTELEIKNTHRFFDNSFFCKVIINNNEKDVILKPKSEINLKKLKRILIGEVII